MATLNRPNESSSDRLLCELTEPSRNEINLLFTNGLEKSRKKERKTELYVNNNDNTLATCQCQ